MVHNRRYHGHVDDDTITHTDAGRLQRARKHRHAIEQRGVRYLGHRVGNRAVVYDGGLRRSQRWRNTTTSIMTGFEPAHPCPLAHGDPAHCSTC